MQTAIELNALVGSYAAALPDLSLSSDDKEECLTVLLWLKNIIEAGTPNERIVRECVEYLDLRISSLLPNPTTMMSR